MVSKAPTDSPLLTQAQEPDEGSWEAVPDAPGLFRVELVKADGRRMIVYRRLNTDSA